LAVNHDIQYAPRCFLCDERMSVQGRISLPPESIYRCIPCGVEVWVPTKRSLPKLRSMGILELTPRAELLE
jgi:hypothetical protein